VKGELRKNVSSFPPVFLQWVILIELSKSNLPIIKRNWCQKEGSNLRPTDYELPGVFEDNLLIYIHISHFSLPIIVQIVSYSVPLRQFFPFSYST
jgi:hypothetical protein